MHSLAIATGNVLAGIAFDPTIRGILAVGVGVVVLMGSVYLLLGTNTGNRLGFLLAMTGFFGWMAIMGFVWWIYGIGMVGEAPSWQVVEYNAADTSQAVTEEVRDLDLSALPTDGSEIDYEAIDTLAEEDPEAFAELSEQVAQESNGWELLLPSDAVRNEIEATVAAELPECSNCDFGISEADDYVVLAAYQVGGKDKLPDDPSTWDRIKLKVTNSLQLTHPDHYAILEVRRATEQETEVGQAPPIPEADPNAPVINVVMLRDIGDLRFPAAMITIGSSAIFLLLCWVLHRRERILEHNLDNAERVAAGGA